MPKFAQKWSESKKTYSTYKLPEGAVIYAEDMNKIISCAGCGKELPYGECFTSREIHTQIGIGYGVCETCYFDEEVRYV